MYAAPVGPSKWTDEIDELMRANWMTGISATNCAKLIHARFGVEFTRMAIIGRATRRGYQTTGSNRLGRPRDPNKLYPVKRKKPRRTIAPRLGAPRIAIEPAPPAQPHNKPTASRNMTLLELGPHDCRYPTSPDDATSHLFCGATQHGDGPYCFSHAQVCYRATQRMMENPAQVPPSPTDLAHNKTRSEQGGSSV